MARVGGDELEEEEELDVFAIHHKHATHERLRQWRKATLALNATRRFRYTLNLERTEEARNFPSKKAVKHYQQAGTGEIDGCLPPQGFGVGPRKLQGIVKARELSFLHQLGEVSGVAKSLRTNIEEGLSGDTNEILLRKIYFGENNYPRRKQKRFFVFVCETFQDTTLIILMLCAAISLITGMTSKGGVKEGWYDGTSIACAILAVVLVTALSDYKQSLEFQALNDEKKNIHVQVVRMGRTFRTSIFELVVGDIVPLNIGDQVTGVGLNTEWGQIMAAISEDIGEETPLQVRLNGTATFIGKVGLIVSVLVFSVLFIRYFTDKYNKHQKASEVASSLSQIFSIADPCRPGVAQAVSECKSAGVKVCMVTGDNLITAISIARECGIYSDGLAIEGSDFRNYSNEEMITNLKNLQVLARSLPSDKLLLVQKLKENSEVVAVTGDGTNDAPALHEANIGLAMGISGTEVAKESSDVIILDDNFASVVKMMRWGRSVYANIQKFIQFQLTVNVAALAINFVAAVSNGSVPLQTVQMLWVNLIMDTLGALALATEPPTDDLMSKPSIGLRDPLVTNVMWRNILGQIAAYMCIKEERQLYGPFKNVWPYDVMHCMQTFSGAISELIASSPAAFQVMVLLTLFYKGIDLLHLDGTKERKDIVRNTTIFNTFVFCQLFNEINARKPEEYNVFAGILKNRMFVSVVVISIIFQGIMVESLNKFAKTTKLSWEQWLISIGIGFLSLPIGLVLKFIKVPRKPLIMTHKIRRKRRSRPDRHAHQQSANEQLDFEQTTWYILDILNAIE